MPADYTHEFLTLSIAHFCMLTLPGPDFALVMQQTISHGRKYGLLTSLGIITGLSVHILYTLAGISFILAETPAVFTLIEVIGASYLGYIAYHLIRPHPNNYKVDISTEQVTGTKKSGKKAYLAGLFCNLLNPKVSLFFLAIFTTVVDSHTPKSVQAAYALWLILTALIWFIIVSYLFSNRAIKGYFTRFGPWFERITGFIILGFAIRLVINVFE